VVLRGQVPGACSVKNPGRPLGAGAPDPTGRNQAEGSVANNRKGHLAGGGRGGAVAAECA